MSFATKWKVALAAGALLVATLFVTAPASATHYYVHKHCGYTSMGTYCWNHIHLRSTQPATAPARTTTAAMPTQPAPAPTQTTAGLSAQEQQMLNLVNSQRSRAGLRPLQADLTLTRLARMKSQDMITNRYFSHQSPTYGSPFQMLKRYGVSYRTAAENIAGNRSVDGAHIALMNSSGHRANIMNGQFTHVGIGIVSGGSYGMMFTQLFIAR